ncbi:hypothetical protein K9N68_22960 [Kovacikia minuta CCNUW1]|uniref:hypothetical protein n=1 Tax=Kovacikia minuta TaxID=2931930 RepID=UPI001CCE0B1A|nr:hypothetical protein [Kovacikia minuta]UBF24531.1 hypothetical protein K9N68_22960 [Kovacikia minuta CCNUW1]
MNNSSRTDWERIDAMADEEIDTSDIPPLDESFFATAKLRMPRKSKSTNSMNHTLNLSEGLYARLRDTAHRHGLPGIEQLLEKWLLQEEERHQRQETVRKITALREQLFTKYGEMLDSVDLIREDRTR